MIISSLWTVGLLGSTKLNQLTRPTASVGRVFLCALNSKVLSTNRPVIVHALWYVDYRFVIAVRVSGGHLCEAEAPTEPAGETAVRCAAIRFSLKGYLRILSYCALRMTDHLVIAKPCKRLRQSVPFYRKYGFLNPALKTTKTNPL